MLKQPKYKRFNYKPRFQEGQEPSNTEKFEENWERVRQNARHKTFKMSKLTLLLILLVVVLILMYLLSNI